MTNSYWPLVLDTLKQEVSAAVFRTWFSNIEYLKIENTGHKIVLEVPSGFNKKYLQNKYQKILLNAINRFYPRVIHIDFEVSKKVQANNEEQEDIFQNYNSKTDTKNQDFSNLKKDLEYKKSQINLNGNQLKNKNINYLNSKYSFQNFVELSCNRLAVSVAKAVLENPGKSYNPVFLYSGVGLGKTHLLQAIGHEILSTRPEFKIKYSTCENFFNLFITSIQNKNSKDFAEYFRSVDILLLDDVQFLAGKEATQEAFFHTFNELHQKNKQIILTSDKPPKHLIGLTERLVSRFEWGIVIDILKPDLEDRISVIQAKVKQQQIPLSQIQITKIARAVDTNFRDIEGVLNRLKARIDLLPDKPLGESELDSVLSGYESGSIVKINLSPNATTNLSPNNIVAKVCQSYAITKEEIFGKSRIQNVAEARQVAMYFFKSKLEFSYPAISKFFKRDHTTAMHAFKKIETRIEKDKHFKQRLQGLF